MQFYSCLAISITVAYSGAYPSEIEESIVTVIEKKVSGLSEVREIKSSIKEGYGQINAEIAEGENIRAALSDVKAKIGVIDGFPKDMEEPVVKRAARGFHAVNIVVVCAWRQLLPGR